MLRHSHAPYIFFTDFDGTITTKDSNDYLTDNLGFGLTRRRELNIDILTHKVSFPVAFKQMLDSVMANGHKFSECKKALVDNIVLDPGFKLFFEWAKSANVPVVVVSSGMEPNIRAVLENLLGKSDADLIDIVSNHVDLAPDDSWQIRYRHPESPYGHDKSKAIRPYRELAHKPVLFFAGDGVSDMSAAGESDVLFVRIKDNGENDLAKHCDNNRIPYIPFQSFTEIQDKVSRIVEGKESVGKTVSQAVGSI